MSNCLFCKIVSGDIPADKVYESELVIAFRDIDPQAPLHILVIPKKHIKNITSLNVSEGVQSNQSEDEKILVELFAAVSKIAEEQGVAEGGFRTVINQGADGGQEVQHLHLHIIGGRQMLWPPG